MNHDLEKFLLVVNIVDKRYNYCFWFLANQRYFINKKKKKAYAIQTMLYQAKRSIVCYINMKYKPSF